MTLTKIRMTNHRGDNSEIQIVSFARPDGMIIGSATQSGESCFGEDPAKLEVRYLLTMAEAIAHTKNKCREYCGREDVDFTTEEGAPMVQPAGQGQMPRRRM